MPVVWFPMVYGNIVKKVALGFNSDREAYAGCCYITHSEMDAMNKLKKNKNSKPIPIDIYVIRVNKNGELRNSKPCFQCCKYMNVVSTKKGYYVKHVIYSNEHGETITIKFHELFSSKDGYISTYFRKRGKCKIK
jgi:hypothetical protein